ncbi:MAG: type 1 glutamine amidotransferase domain-containing protein [Alphaproteobacteria bacterium]|nr:type 1 glutamine amidotransferase domain-containing protein [Alphaproteobacteria bacterium]
MRSLTTVGLVIAALAVGAWIGLPLLFKTLGLHPDYAGERIAFPGGRALIVTTSHGALSPGTEATGVFASEMTGPYYVFNDAGLHVDVASIAGGAIPIDPLSFYWFVETHDDKRFKVDAAFRGKVRNALKIDDVDFASYDIVYLAGGWGAAYDLGQSDVLGRKLTEAWKAGRILGGVCHGPRGLLRTQDETGAPLVRGRRVTGVSDKQVQELGITMTPLHPERELRAAGARFEGATAFRDIFANHVVSDGRLITGQNQNAALEVAATMIAAAKRARERGALQ